MLAVERRDTDAAWNAAVQVCMVQVAEIEEQREEGSQEECAEAEGDVRREAESRYEPEGLRHEDTKGEEDGEEVSKEVNEPEQLVYETGEEYKCETPKHNNGKAFAHGEPQHEQRGLEDGEKEISEREMLEFGEYELHEPGELEYEPTCSNGVDEPPEGEDNSIREHEDNTTHPAPSPTANMAANPVPYEPQRFDWATDTNTSIGPVPSVIDYCPTVTPSNSDMASVPAHRDHALPKPTVTLSNDDMAPFERTPTTGVPTTPHVHTPASPTDPTTPRAHTSTMHAPMNCTPAVHTPAAPTLANPDTSKITADAIHTNTSLVPVSTNRITLDNLIPVVFAKPDPITRTVSTPLIVHGPCDFSALRSDTRNPWGSLNHHRRRPYSHSYHTDLRLKPLNQSSSRPPHPHNPAPSILPLQHSSNLESNSYSQQPPAPVNIIQTIQHPRGISPTKPKITKYIPANSTPSAITQDHNRFLHCTCGATLPVPGWDRDSWRPMDINRRRFEGEFDSRFRRRFSRRFSWRFSRRFQDW